MFTTGSKLLIGSAVLATIAAIGYGITQDGVMGTVGLASAAVALAFLAGVNIYTKDANVFADEPDAVATAAAQHRAPSNSAWPMVLAVGAVAMTLGLVTYPAIFIIGLLVVFAAGAEWVSQAWADRASTEAGHNEVVRNRIANPLEFPLAGAIGIGIIVYAFSRVMLALDENTTVIAFALLGALIITLAGVFSLLPRISSRSAIGVLGIGVVALVASGVAAGLGGERDNEHHETTEQLASEGICTSPDEFEADANASQSVGDSANVAADITLGADGQLTYDMPGSTEQGAEGMTLTKATNNNVIFHNESDHQRRLSVDLGTQAEDGSDEEVPFQMCTTLIDPDGSQNITLNIPLPSSTTPDGFFFFVPGVDSAHLNLIVP